VFNYKEADFAAYVKADAGYSLLDQDAFVNSSGVGSHLSGTSNYNYGGELGFVYFVSSALHWRFSAEVFAQHPVNSEGTDGSGAALFALSSTVFVFNPKVGFEYVLSSQGSTRYYFSGGVGYATINVTNTYQMTSTGTSALGPTDFKESLVANSISGDAEFGLETLFTDRVTFFAELGYRYLPVQSLTYGSQVNNIADPGGATKGAPVLNQDGSTRRLNLSGPIAGVAFRFYLD
jgi:hypothetical protein